jgi:hypothetical protein
LAVWVVAAEALAEAARWLRVLAEALARALRWVAVVLRVVLLRRRVLLLRRRVVLPVLLVDILFPPPEAVCSESY